MAVEFQEENLSSLNLPSRNFSSEPKLPFLTRFMLGASGGLLKNKNQADLAWVVMAVFILFLSGYFLFSHTKYAYPSGKNHEQEDLDYIKAYQASQKAKGQ